MTDTTPTVPEWAIQKALKLMEYGGTPLRSVLAEPNEHFEVIAFAHYIAEHEEPPVDPLLIEARAIIKRCYPEVSPNYSGRRLTIAMDALRRGIELAREQQP